MKILLVDDHAIFREGIRRILQDEFPTAQFDEGSNAEMVVQQLTRYSYDIVICDLTLPGRTGLDLVKQLKKLKNEIPVLILSMHREDEYAIRALKAGAAGYLNKSSSSSELIKAIQRILQGRKYISESTIERLSEDKHLKEGKLSHEELSDRELEVFKLVAEGRSLSDIANQLSLSLSTISTHRTRILKKLQLKSNAALIKYAITHNLL